MIDLRTTVVLDDGREFEVGVEITDYEPGEPAHTGGDIPENWSPGVPDHIQWCLVHPDKEYVLHHMGRRLPQCEFERIDETLRNLAKPGRNDTGRSL